MKKFVTEIINNLNKIYEYRNDAANLLWIFSVIYYITNKYESDVKSFLGAEYTKAENKLYYVKNNKLDEDLIDYCQQEPRVTGLPELVQGKQLTPLILWYIDNKHDIKLFENAVRKKLFTYIPPQYLWSNIREVTYQCVLEVLISDCCAYIKQELNIDITLTRVVNAKAWNYFRDIIKVIDKYLSSEERTDAFWSSYFAVIEELLFSDINTIYDCLNTLTAQIIASEVQTNDLPTDSILDCSCGTGSTLITTIKQIEKSGKSINHIYAQDEKYDSCSITRFNMLVNNLGYKANVFNGNTIDNTWDVFAEQNTLCDIIVADVPFSQAWLHQIKHTTDIRFKDYALPPQSTADAVFLLHGLRYLSQQGVMAMIIPSSLLFRGGAEYNIRRKLIEDNNIEAIIQLPAPLYKNTGMPAMLVVLKKHRTTTDIFFINANKQKEVVKRGFESVMRAEHISAVVDAYKERKEIDNFSRMVTLEEIIQEDYNINVSRYVSTAEEDRIIHLDENIKELTTLEKNIKAAVKEHNKCSKKLKLIGVS